MKFQNILTSFHTSQKIFEAGYEHETLFLWKHPPEGMGSPDLVKMGCLGTQYEGLRYYPAYTVQELGIAIFKGSIKKVYFGHSSDRIDGPMFIGQVWDGTKLHTFHAYSEVILRSDVLLFLISMGWVSRNREATHSEPTQQRGRKLRINE